ncbi:hypothetical protein RA086_11985 [Lactiplantibacillus sp. WILCCON 0030]|uniref:Uncharacterized protein n=1 Tax=Lactiplantibacillus brownii TaxID=3069269 RepID=A0ABU1ABM0_9LACO|nr:hypothetical protein [Lactiplantibacillus brownii]MDQ7938329.1 hypothetical protein [Lactiplantibacillus brownii]
MKQSLTASALQDAGMSVGQVEQVLKLSQPQQRLVLGRYRQGLLVRVHRGQQQLYCTDFLIKQLQPGKDVSK